ncbi:MAG: AIR synthase-related protein [archaeon GB-1845-036]|nr:AIR synthase-related protein [Candidatus Culexmicrobium thermophilum]
MSEIYRKMGVDASKKDVRIMETSIKRAFPYAFTDIFKWKESKRCFALHVDGAGSKPIISYLLYKEFGESFYFKLLPQDVLAMNMDDVVAAGVKPLLFVDYLAINPFKLDRSIVLKELSEGFRSTLSNLTSISVLSKSYTPIFIGGETADLPDQVRTLDVVGAVYGEANCNNIIDGSKISKGDLIIGLSSTGRLSYELKMNSGIMCNGLTLARHILLSKYYLEKYPEIANESSGLKYLGRFTLDDFVDDLDMTIGEALSSPTRIYTPILSEILHLFQNQISGMVHVTGGGLTKILRVGYMKKYVITKLPSIPPIFKLIGSEGHISLDEMYKVFNMGVGFIIIVKASVVDDLFEIFNKYNLDSLIMGYVDDSPFKGNVLSVKCGDLHFSSYRKFS